jgi:hypothetical protein
MIDRRTGGAPPLSGQNAPTILPNGHVLLFDNGPHRLDQTFPFSRVLGDSGGNPARSGLGQNTPGALRVLGSAGQERIKS